MTDNEGNLAASIPIPISINNDIDLGGKRELCKGESEIITAQIPNGSGTYNYTWSTGETTESITVAPEQSQFYSMSNSFIWISILLANFCVSDICNNTTVELKVSDDLTKKIKYEVIRNTTLNNIYHKIQYLKHSKTEMFSNDFVLKTNQYLNFPGFGYQAHDLELEIVKVGLSYPDPDWSLYEISFPYNENNRQLLNWWGKKRFPLFSNTSFLIAVDKTNDIKYISGNYLFLNPIAKDFSLDINDPDSYIEFLELKLFDRKYDEINFIRKEDNYFFYRASKKIKNNDFLIREYKIDIDNPDAFFKSTVVSGAQSKIEKNRIGDLKKIEFNTIKEKERFLLDALMRNIYLKHCFHNSELIESSLKYDSASRLNLENDFNIIPAFDEYLGAFELDKKVVCWDDDLSVKKFKENKFNIENPILCPENGHRVVCGNIKNSERFEFYYFYRDTSNILFKRSNAGVLSPESFRKGLLDTHSQIHVNKIDSFSSCLKEVPYSDWIENCPIPPPTIQSYHNQLLLYYLLVLDTKTNVVYFVSGEDIFLSDATRFYNNYDEKRTGNEEFRECNIFNKLCYIKDRLTSYQIGRLSEENIIENDDTKLKIKSISTKEGTAKTIIATLFYDNPEVLSIDFEN